MTRARSVSPTVRRRIGRHCVLATALALLCGCSDEPAAPLDGGAQAVIGGGDVGVAAATGDVDLQRTVEVVAEPQSEAAPPTADELAADGTLRHDCGHVAAGTEIRHVFALHNGGATAVQILRAMPSQRCRMRFAHSIAPGADGTFEVTVATRDLAPGPVRIAIRVQTANRALDRVIVLEAVIDPAVAAQR